MLDKIVNFFNHREVKSSQMHSSLDFFPLLINQYNSNTDKADHLFKTNVVVYRCISLIAKSIASIDWYLTDAKGPINKHDLDYLLHSPNPLQSRESFLETLITNLFLYGNAYIYRTGSTFHSWQVLNTKQVQIKYTNKGIPDYYIYKKYDSELKIPIDKETGASDLLNIKLFNTNHEQFGMSPCEVISKVVEFYNKITEYNISFLNKSSRPSGVLMVKNEGLTEAQFAEIKQNFKKWHEGTANVGEAFIMTDNCKWEPSNGKSLETSFIEGQHAAARQIAQVFGVPPMLIGIEGDSTFSNYKEARVHFWEDTILPLMHRICGEITAWMFRPYNIQLVPDINNIEALEPKRHEKWLETEQVSFLTKNEKRARFGYAPLNESI